MGFTGIQTQSKFVNCTLSVRMHVVAGQSIQHPQVVEPNALFNVPHGRCRTVK